MKTFNDFCRRIARIVTICMCLTAFSSCDFIKRDEPVNLFRFWFYQFQGHVWENEDSTFSIYWKEGSGTINYQGVEELQASASSIFIGSDFDGYWTSYTSAGIIPDETGPTYSYLITEVISDSEILMIVTRNGQTICGGEMKLIKIEE